MLLVFTIKDKLSCKGLIAMLYATLLSAERRGKQADPDKKPAKISQIFFSSLAMMLLLSGCAISGSATTTLSGRISISGSTALYPLAQQAAKLFEQLHPDIHITVQGIGSIKGLQAVTARKVDIGTSDIYADPALYPDPNLTDHIVCVIPFAMIVNSDVPL